jgi:hypothetical protein
MPSKREYRDRKFLFFGIVMGGLLEALWVVLLLAFIYAH